MKRLWKWIAAGLVVVVAGGGFAFWYFWLRDDAPPEAALRVRTGSTASTTATDSTGGSAAQSPDGTWKVVPGEEVFVGYRVDELFGGDTLKKTAVGRTKAVDGTITIAGTSVADGSFTADLTQLKSDKDRRDNYLKDSSLQTSEFPDATFKLTAPVDLGAVSAGKAISVTAKGDLTLHGVTKAVSLPLQARWNADSIDVAGKLPVQFADYDIDKPSVPILSTDDHGIMELQLSFERA